MNGKVVVVVEEEGEEDDNNGIEMFPGEQIIVECCDGKELEIPLEIAMMSPKVVDMIKNNEYVEEETTSPYLFPPVPEKYKKIVLKDVPSFGLSRVLEYCKYHENCEEKSLRERDFWDADFLDQEDVYNICVLAKAAYYLDVKPLIDLSCRELASRMRNLSVKQLIDLFHIKQKKDFLPVNEKKPPVFLRQADIFRREFGLTGGTSNAINQAYDLIICDRHEKPELSTTKEKSKLVYEALMKRQRYLNISKEELDNVLKKRVNNHNNNKMTASSAFNRNINKIDTVGNFDVNKDKDDELIDGFIELDDGRIFVNHKLEMKKVTLKVTDQNIMVQKSYEALKEVGLEEYAFKRPSSSSSSDKKKTEKPSKKPSSNGKVARQPPVAAISKKNKKIAKAAIVESKNNGNNNSDEQLQSTSKKDMEIKNLHAKSVDDILNFIGEDTSTKKEKANQKKLSKRAKKRLRQKEKQRQQKEEQLRAAKKEEEAKLLAIEQQKKKEEIKKMLRSGSTDLTNLKDINVEDIFDESQFDDEDVEAEGDDEIAAFAARLEESFISVTPKVNRRKVNINTKDVFS